MTDFLIYKTPLKTVKKQRILKLLNKFLISLASILNAVLYERARACRTEFLCSANGARKLGTCSVSEQPFVLFSVLVLHDGRLRSSTYKLVVQSQLER